MSDYELERMDPAAYADAVEREQQDPLRPYRLKVEKLEVELATLRKENAEQIARGLSLAAEVDELREALSISEQKNGEVVFELTAEIARLRKIEEAARWFLDEMDDISIRPEPYDAFIRALSPEEAKT